MGGVAIFLTLVALALIVALAFFLFGTGGFLWKRKTDPAEDRVEPDVAEPTSASGRPRHTRPSDVAQERTGFVGTPRGDDAAHESPR